MPIFLSLNKVFYFRFHFCEFSVPALHCKYKIYIENVFRQYILVQGWFGHEGLNDLVVIAHKHPKSVDVEQVRLDETDKSERKHAL